MLTIEEIIMAAKAAITKTNQDSFTEGRKILQRDGIAELANKIITDRTMCQATEQQRIEGLEAVRVLAYGEGV